MSDTPLYDQLMVEMSRGEPQCSTAPASSEPPERFADSAPASPEPDDCGEPEAAPAEASSPPQWPPSSPSPAVPCE
jgi:hypothetical protein